MSDVPSEWQGILGRDERILWQGAPTPGLRLSGGLGLSAFGTVFTAFSLFWMAAAGWIGSGTGVIGTVFPLFGLPFLLIGLYMMVGRFVWGAYVRRGTFYTLTNRRAFVATANLGRRALVAYEIDGGAPLELVVGPPDSVFFKATTDHGPHGRLPLKVGFEYIDNGRRVFNLLRDVQKGTA